MAKLRKHRQSDRIADKWSMQRMAVDIGELHELLRVAVDDFESTHGRPIPEKMPNHWAVTARRLVYGE
jgi:hypothetical protein